MCGSPYENVVYEYILDAKHVLLLLFGWFVRQEVSDRAATALRLLLPEFAQNGK